MAKIIIENCTITEVFGNFNSWYRVEEYIEGLSYPKKYTVWANESKYSVGDLIRVEGDLGVKGRPYERAGEQKATVDVSVNNPKITVIAAARVANETPAPVEELLGAVEINPNAPF